MMMLGAVKRSSLPYVNLSDKYIFILFSPFPLRRAEIPQDSFLSDSDRAPYFSLPQQSYILFFLGDYLRRGSVGERLSALGKNRRFLLAVIVFEGQYALALKLSQSGIHRLLAHAGVGADIAEQAAPALAGKRIYYLKFAVRKAEVQRRLVVGGIYFSHYKIEAQKRIGCRYFS